jgi:DNA polymerase-4
VTVLELADRCASRLRAQGLVGRVVSVKLRTSDFRTVSRSRTLPSPVDTAAEIAATARELLAGIDLHGLPVRLVGVRAEGLTPRIHATSQPTLEESLAPAGPPSRAAEEALDAVRARFGVNSVRRASVVARSTTTPRAGELS